jgi:hypothetical protein
MSDSPEKKFKAPEQINFEDHEQEAGNTLRTFDLSGYTPEASPDKRQFKAGPDLSDILEYHDDGPAFRTSAALGLLEQDILATKELAARVPLRSLENGEDAQSQSRTFRMPPMAADPLSDSQTQPDMTGCLEDTSFDISPPSPEITNHASCPMCGESVDAIFLKNYNNGKRMNIRMQGKFCRAHKKNSAHREWIDKRYPTINWSDLDTRLTENHSFIKDLLDGAPSHYRNILDEQVRAGKDRTLLQAVQNSNVFIPGYYGSRGLRAMSENIMSKFSPHLRRIAVKDRLVAARGVTGYVQNVLVPELAVKLIAEDMGLEVEEARQVMRDSAGLGDLLNEEVEDVVVWNPEDEVE